MVVPGYVVDSRTTSWPGRRASLTAWPAAKICEMSGSRVFESGVGTQRQITSHSRRRTISIEASRRPARRSSDTRASATSRTWLCPSLTPRDDRFVDIEAEDRTPASADFHGEGQSDVAEANHAKGHIAFREAAEAGR